MKQRKFYKRTQNEKKPLITSTKKTRNGDQLPLYVQKTTKSYQKQLARCVVTFKVCHF